MLISRHARGLGQHVQLIGFAADESHRSKTKNMLKRAGMVRFPLIEWGVPEQMALSFCKQRGFTWGGLYDHFRRVSCFCCPLQGLDELRTLRRHYQELWHQMLEWESQMQRPIGHKRFKHNSTLHDIDARFAREDSVAAVYGAIPPARMLNRGQGILGECLAMAAGR